MSKPLNPNASSFNPNAKAFVPSFGAPSVPVVSPAVLSPVMVPVAMPLIPTTITPINNLVRPVLPAAPVNAAVINSPVTAPLSAPTTTPPKTSLNPKAVAFNPSAKPFVPSALTNTPATTATTATTSSTPVTPSTPATTTPASAPPSTTPSTPATPATPPTSTPSPAPLTNHVTPAPVTGPSAEQIQKEKAEKEEATKKAKEEEERIKREKEENEKKEKEEAAKKAKVASLLPKGINTNVRRPVVSGKPAEQRQRQLKNDDDDHADQPDIATARDVAVNLETKDEEEKPVAKEEKKEEIKTNEAAIIQPSAGSKVYDKAWMLSVRHTLMIQPKSWEQIESLLKKFGLEAQAEGAERPKGGNGGGHSGWREQGGEFRPQRANNRQPQRSAFSDNARDDRRPRGGKGDKQQNRDGRNVQKKDQPLDITVAPLEMSENRYRLLNDVPNDQKLLRQFNSILNKLTPEKFDTLVDRTLELQITSAAMLRDLVQALFEKALAEPNFSPTYAEFCVKLSSRLPSFNADDNDSSQSQSFKRLLLNRCQSEFENEPTPLDAETLAKMSEEEKTDYDSKQKRRLLGSIRFIGELFARSMLNTNIIRYCLVVLLGDANNPVEEDIEALCKLLEVVGKMLDTKNNKDFMERLFTSMETIRGAGKVSSRHRFMIQDAIDLRARNWVKRRAVEEAKKISDIHKEEQKVEKPKKPTPAPTRPVATTRPVRGGDRYSLAKVEKKKEDDEWETVGSSKKKGGSQDIRKQSSPNRSKKNHSSSNNSSIKTKSGAGKTDDEPPKVVRTNTFSALGGEEEENDEINEENYEEGEGEEEEVGVEDGAEEEEEEIDDLKVRDPCNSLVKEYFQSDDLKEVSLSVKELPRAARMRVLVRCALLKAVEEKERERLLIPKLFNFLLTEKLITKSDIEEGIDDTLIQLEDVSLDTPMAPQFIGGIYGHLVNEQLIALKYLDQCVVLKEIDEDSKFKFVCSALQSIQKVQGNEGVVGEFNDAALSWKLLGKNINEAKNACKGKQLEAIADILA